MTRLVVLLALLGGVAHAQGLDEAEKKDGFVSLFNGKDLGGWRFTGKTHPNWTVEDGLIKLSGKGGPHLVSAWDYEDFDIRFEWRAVRANYNSGFYVRSGRNVGTNQINLAKGAEGGLVGGKAKGAKAVPELQKKPMEWNEWRVLVVGENLTFWCNGKQAWEATDWTPLRGYVGLQEEGAPIEFRNLRIKELGYTSLMDAKSWEGIDGKSWKLEQAELSGEKDAALTTSKKDYRNFVLRLEYKGAEGRLIIGDKDKALTLCGIRAGFVDGVKPQRGGELLADDWNCLEVRLNGGKAAVWLNGTVMYDQVSFKGGTIALQAGKSLRLRNVRVREIKD